MGSSHLSPPWPAPGKLNLGLRIVGRRGDGYHRLQTIFQFIDYCDYLHFTPRQDGRITRCGGLSDLPEAADLTVRAARLLRDHHGPTPGVTIHLDKRLPTGGGLGGGSSDAATTLVALNHHWQLNLSIQTLMELGLSLGADVPVFLRGHAALGEDIGERLTPLELSEPWFVVLVPGVSVSTREIFAAPDLTRDSPPARIRDLVRGQMINDCESVVFHRFPEVKAAARWLSHFSEPHLTGTGACVFAVFKRYHEAAAVVSRAPCNAFLAAAKNRSPLRERLQQEKMKSVTGP